MSEINSDLQKVIKRLELIKSLISLEEEDEIELHISRLQKLGVSNEIEQIIFDLQQKAYGNAIVKIGTFIKYYNQVTLFIDPEIEALKFEAKALERELQQLSDEKAELDKLIHDFGVRHNQELGELIIKLLEYRKEQTRGTPEEEEALKDYEEFHQTYEATKDEKVITLDDDEQAELKSKYRKASKLCHPDVVNETQKDIANKIFIELNEAYEKNDLERVAEILLSLENGILFTSRVDVANEKQTLKVELERLRIRLNEIKSEINYIKATETYVKVTSIENWDAYFENTKQELNAQLKELENRNE